MEISSELPNLKIFDDDGTHLPLFPFSFLHDSKSSDSSPVESRGNRKPLEGLNHHERCSSEFFLIEDQPSWLDDLLDDSDTVSHKGHRRSASDSYALFGEAAATFALGDESKFVNAYFGTSARSQNLALFKDVDNTYIETKGHSVAQKNNQEPEERASPLDVENSRQEFSSQDKAGGSQVKNSGSKTDSKRSKQKKLEYQIEVVSNASATSKCRHNAHRSRVRKLQYIAHLERTVQILKAEGSGISAELEFVEQQNMILTMENRALRQQLESLSEEQIIKNWEQGMLEREISRLQSLYHLKKQQQMQMHHQEQQLPHNHHCKQRRNKNRDLDQVNSTSMKNKNASSSKGSVSSSIHV